MTAAAACLCLKSPGTLFYLSITFTATFLFTSFSTAQSSKCKTNGVGIRADTSQPILEVVIKNVILFFFVFRAAFRRDLGWSPSISSLSVLGLSRRWHQYRPRCFPMLRCPSLWGGRNCAAQWEDEYQLLRGLWREKWLRNYVLLSHVFNLSICLDVAE